MKTAIRPGEYGVRYASDRDHAFRGWIFTDCLSVRQAVDAADMFLAERGLTCVMLHVVDSSGATVEEVSRGD